MDYRYLCICRSLGRIHSHTRRGSSHNKTTHVWRSICHGDRLEGKDEKTLQYLTSALLSPRTLSKFIYASWIRCFEEGEGREGGLVVEALLPYYLSWFILPRGPEDGITFLFSQWLSSSQKERLALAPLYPRLLYARLDECVTSITRSFGRYDVVTHANTGFLQIFLWERSRAIAPKPV